MKCMWSSCEGQNSRVNIPLFRKTINSAASFIPETAIMVLKLHLEVGIIIVMDIFACTTFCCMAHSSKQQLMNFSFYSIKYM